MPLPSSWLCTALVVAVLSALTSTAVWHVAPYQRCGVPDDDYYDDRPITAPVLAHPALLSLAARLLTSSPLGDWLTRALLRRNGVTCLIELAHTLHHRGDAHAWEDPLQPTPPVVSSRSGPEFGLGEPLVRLDPQAYAWHVQQAAATDETVASAEASSFSSSGSPSYRSVRAYHHAYATQQTTPTVVLQRLLRFIHETNETLRCIETLDDEARLYAAAAAATKRFQTRSPDDTSRSLSIWDGVPVLVKAEVAVAGLSHSAGRAPAASHPAPEDDVLVQRFRQAGAIVLGTTVMHELGVQPTGFNSHYGGPMNPYDATRFSGGSSSGSAVAVATGMVPLAIGVDGGGSIRIPAAWSGTVGLAVGYGRIPTSGPSVSLVSVGKAGPLAATIQDAADALWLLGQPLSETEGRAGHLYHVAYGGDGPPPPHWTPRWHVTSDKVSVDNRVEEKNGKDDDSVVRMGVFSEWVSHRATGTAQGADDAVYERYQETLSRLTSPSKSGGRTKYQVVDFSMSYMKEQALAHGLLISAMFAFRHANELYRDTTSRRNGPPEAQHQPATQIQLKLGQQISAIELMACLRLRAYALAQWRFVLLHRADVILTPTVPMTALRRPPGSDVKGFTDTALFVQMMRFAWPANLAGLPSLAVPVGIDGIGLPVSVQVICLHWHEADCLAVGADIERLFAKERPTPPAELFFDPL